MQPDVRIEHTEICGLTVIESRIVVGAETFGHVVIHADHLGSKRFRYGNRCLGQVARHVSLRGIAGDRAAIAPPLQIGRG